MLLTTYVKNGGGEKKHKASNNGSLLTTGGSNFSEAHSNGSFSGNGSLGNFGEAPSNGIGSFSGNGSLGNFCEAPSNGIDAPPNGIDNDSLLALPAPNGSGDGFRMPYPDGVKEEGVDIVEL